MHCWLLWIQSSAKCMNERKCKTKQMFVVSFSFSFFLVVVLLTSELKSPGPIINEHHNNTRTIVYDFTFVLNIIFVPFYAIPYPYWNKSKARVC